VKGRRENRIVLSPVGKAHPSLLGLNEKVGKMISILGGIL